MSIESNQETVSILILNWNNSIETIMCIESLTGLESMCNFNLIVVDNNSKDDSVTHLKTYFSENNIDYLYQDLEKETLLTDGALNNANVIIRNNVNSGYAGGNNVGINFILNNTDSKYIWILNNDIVLQRESFNGLFNEIEKDQDVGFVSSVLVYKNTDPLRVQAFGGGKIYPYLGVTSLIGKGRKLSELGNNSIIPDYLMGASILVRTDTIKDIGLMDEAFFMYYEEIDWQIRAKRAGWKVAVAEKSIVFHGDSGSTKNNKWKYHFYRNRAAIMFVKKHYSLVALLISAPSLVAITVLKNLSNLNNIVYGIKGVYGGLCWDRKSKVGEL
jgi:GT2 family glycosyltransferase